MLLVVIVLAACLEAAAGAGGCQYGTLPGTYRNSQPPGKKWRLLTSSCQLQNLVAAYGGQEPTAPKPPPLSILFLSDSMDRMLVSSFCDTFGGQKNPTQTFADFNYCFNKKSGSLSLGQVYVATMTPRDSVIIGGFPTLMGYKERMRWGKKAWAKQYPGTEPDVVVLGGGVWDIQRWMVSPTTSLAAPERQVRSKLDVPPKVIDWWISNVKDTIGFTKDLFPKSRVMWRTFAMPKWDPTTGRATNRALGSKAMLAEIKAAGKAAALEMGVPIIDIDRIVQEFARPDQYLFDLHHAKPAVYMEALNIILNQALRS